MSALNDTAKGFLLNSISGSSLTQRNINVTGSAVATLYAPVAGRTCFTLQTICRQGDFGGTISLQGSNESGSWVTYQSASFSPGQGVHLYNVSDFGATLARLLITPTIGSGSLDVLYRGKQ